MLIPRRHAAALPVTLRAACLCVRARRQACARLRGRWHWPAYAAGRLGGGVGSAGGREVRVRGGGVGLTTIRNG